MSETHPPDDVPLRRRIAENPRPAVVWGVVMLVLVALEFGALAEMVLLFVEGTADAIVTVLNSGGAEAAASGADSSGGSGQASAAAQAAADSGLLQTITAWKDVAGQVPTLLSRELIPNQGHQTASGAWEGTFLGLSPAIAWAIRATLVYAYTFGFLWWLWRGYRTYVDHYRYADWTPRDDVVRRFSNHRWGQFGLVIVVLFLGMAVFAPTIGPTTIEQNLYQPYSYTIEYFNADAGAVQEIVVGQANLDATSQGTPDQNVGPLSYDQYGRFHPFGTESKVGADLLTFMAYGARVSLFIGMLSIAISSAIAATFGLVTAYYKGLVDLSVVVVSDSIQAIPVILLVILISVVFSSHPIAQVYSGGLLLALIFGLLFWPGLWRAVRGPAFQVSEQEWVDAARSYGQRSTTTMRKHMLPYILGYLLIYGSLTIGGIIITTSALSFLGIGINPPTPEWGRIVANGREYVTTASWHVATIPGVLIVLVVTAFNALGDGIRDAIDPQSETGGDAGAEATAAGGGG